MTTDHRSPHCHPASNTPEPAAALRPKRLLTQNSELKRLGIWNWSIPALAARLPDGRTVRTCPSAGVCAQVCYARAGRYNIPAVRARHLANLRYVLQDPVGWEQAMLTELAAPRFEGRWIRIHDAGDFTTGHPQRSSADPVTRGCAHQSGQRHRDQPPAKAGNRAAPAGDTADSGRTAGPETTP